VASWFRRVMYFLGLDDELDDPEPRPGRVAGDERFGPDPEVLGAGRNSGEPTRGWVRANAPESGEAASRFRDAAIRRSPVGDPPTERHPVVDSPVASNVRPLSRDEAARVHAGALGGAAQGGTKTRLATPIVIAPTRFADAQDIGDQLKAGGPVIVNLEAVQRDLARRMIDFCSGITYGLGGSMKKVADQVFLLTPANVEVPEEEHRRFAPNGVAKD
jgi:cell division inhibitor SepF